jgi:hypothetical protein
MTTTEFNNKWSKHLEEGHYGMSICVPEVIDYMDKEFEEEVKSNSGFTYSQIKTKWGSSRVYTTSDKAQKWEDAIDAILKSLKN